MSYQRTSQTIIPPHISNHTFEHKRKQVIDLYNKLKIVNDSIELNCKKSEALKEVNDK
jgi:hypothetical protein